MDFNVSDGLQSTENGQSYSDYNESHLMPLRISKRHLPKDIIHFLFTRNANVTCFNFTSLDYTARSCEFVFSLYAAILLCSVGFVGNSLTIAVLHRDTDPHRQKSTNWLLQTLAIVDMVFLALTFILLPLRTLAYRSGAAIQFRNAFQYVMMYLFPLLTIAHTMTIWTVVLVTVDRYLAVCRPLNPDWRSLRRVKRAFVVMFIVAVVYNIPHFFKIEVIILDNCENDEQRPLAIHRRFVWNVYFQYIYQGACDFLFRTVGPLVVLVVLNVRIAWAIRELNQKRREMTLQAKEEKNMTVMLIAVVIIFVICQLPFTALSMALKTAAFSPVTLNRKAYSCAIGIANVLIALNSSINFLLYCLIWRKFNRILSHMVTCRGGIGNNRIE